MTRYAELREAAGDQLFGLVEVGKVVEAHGRLWVGHEFRCYLNGREVSDDCFAANDKEGWAKLYLTHGPSTWFGRSRVAYYLGGTTILSACFHGRVVLVPTHPGTPL